jgi:hypothetical protein
MWHGVRLCSTDRTTEEKKNKRNRIHCKVEVPSKKNKKLMFFPRRSTLCAAMMMINGTGYYVGVVDLLSSAWNSTFPKRTRKF